MFAKIQQVTPLALLLIASVNSAMALPFNPSNDPYGNNVTGAIDLLVDTSTHHVYLQFTGYNTNSSMGFGMFALVSAGQTLVSSQYQDLSAAIASIPNYMGYTGSMDGVNSHIISGGINCCCQFDGYGVSVDELKSNNIVTLNSAGYYQYDLGAIYGGVSDLTLYYTNFAAMYPIAGQSYYESLGWGAMYNGDVYEIPVSTASIHYVNATPTPEPASLGFVAAAGIGLLMRRNR